MTERKDINVHKDHRKRLRRKYLNLSLEGFDDHQVLELLLTFSIPRRDTNVLAHQLIRQYGSLAAVLAADPRALMNSAGVGEQTAVLLSLAGAIGHRLKRAQQVTQLKSPATSMPYCVALLEGNVYETAYALSLDKNRRVLYAEKISTGTLTETALHPRLVVESALRHRAQAVILTHNHPSGDVRPSPADLDATAQVRTALSAIGIPLLDHLIVGGGRAYSFTMGALLNGDEIQEFAAIAAEREQHT